MAGVTLPSTKNTDDQSGQGSQVQALVRAMVAGQDFADLPFAQYLMKRQEVTIRDIHLDDGDLAAYNRLLNILRGYLEKELEETLAQFRIKGLSPEPARKAFGSLLGCAYGPYRDLFMSRSDHRTNSHRRSRR
jgi:hypothetical protein